MTTGNLAYGATGTLAPWVTMVPTAPAGLPASWPSKFIFPRAWKYFEGLVASAMMFDSIQNAIAESKRESEAAGSRGDDLFHTVSYPGQD